MIYTETWAFNMKMIFLICCIYLLVGCNPKKKNEVLSENRIEAVPNANDYSNVIHKNLLHELEIFVSKGKKDVIIITIYEDKIALAYNIYYMIPLNGYIILDNKLVAFYYDDEKYVNNWVNTDKLIKTFPPSNYPDDNSEEVNRGYDPNGKLFKVNNNDMTLELVYEGMF